MHTHRTHRTPHSISSRSRRCRRRPPCCLLCGMAYHRRPASICRHCSEDL